MLFLSDLSHHWDIFNRYDVCLVEKVRTYKNETVTDDYYRKTFTENNLPNVYNAYQYFKKNDNSLKYYKNLKHIWTAPLQRISAKTHLLDRHG